MSDVFRRIEPTIDKSVRLEEPTRRLGRNDRSWRIYITKGTNTRIDKQVRCKLLIKQDDDYYPILYP